MDGQDSSEALRVTIHGAARTVTGSCLEFACGDSRVLVDCGMFQGSRTLEALNLADFAFDPASIDAVVLTHAHIDHSGLLPKLVRQGFSGAIWCTAPTAELIAPMLADSGRIQEADVARRNRRRDRAGEVEHLPAYTEADAVAAAALARPVAREAWFEPAPGFRARLWNAAHILGSASVELVAGGTRVLCSGDLGPDNKAFEGDPASPAGWDHVFCESTYGDRRREPTTMAERRRLLAAEVAGAMARGGNLVVPSFALERTQELMLDLAELMRAGQLPRGQVFIDSPLANEITRVFAAHAGELEDLGDGALFTSPDFHAIADVQQSIRVNGMSGAIILAASGMCEGGRIRHHLLHNLARRESTVLFVGFQAEGTLGRALVDGAEMVRISGENVRVRATIRRIDSYSAHADQRELLAWIMARAPIRGSLLLDHGEAQAIEGLRREVGKLAPDLAVRVPELGECWELPAGQPARRLRTGPAHLTEAVGHDWQNDYGAFTASLSQRLRAIRDGQARRKAIAQMRAVLDSFAEHRAKKR